MAKTQYKVTILNDGNNGLKTNLGPSFQIYIKKKLNTCLILVFCYHVTSKYSLLNKSVSQMDTKHEQCPKQQQKKYDNNCLPGLQMHL